MKPNTPLVGSPYEVLTSLAEAHWDAYRHLTFVDKLALWASWAAAGAIFFTLGWLAMAPDDPYGAVSLLLRRGAVSMWVQAAGLAVVASALATILVGRAVPYAGPFAAGLGLVLVSFRAGTAESLLINAGASGVSPGTLAFRMLLESLCWVGVMLLAFGTSAWVSRWCFSRELRVHRPRLSGLPAPAFAGVALVFSLLIFQVLGVSMQSREIRHTQVCFVVGASVWLGCYLAYRVFPARGIVWYILAVMLMVTAGYVWAAVRSAPGPLPLSIPPSNVLRVLPIQFVAMGMVSAIAAYWSNLRHAGDSAIDVFEDKDSDFAEVEGVRS